MKIGQVVKKYNISSHSLYFYINHGLLVPSQENKQYVFTTQTLSDLEFILRLKQMEFSLKDIHRILSLRRISNFVATVDQQELIDLLTRQKRALATRSKEIVHAQTLLDQELVQWSRPISTNLKTGVPLQMLSLLCCPHCGGELMLEQAQMNHRYIFRATLRCNCGHHMSIRDGILHTHNVNQSHFDKPDTGRELYRDLPSNTLSLFERSYHWLIKYLEKENLHGKVILESYVNAWFFLHNHLELLPQDSFLIVTDKFAETLLSYKEIIEQSAIPLNILYIADATTNFPIKKGCIDYCVDFFASNEHNFYHQDIFYSNIKSYLAQNAQLFGVYFALENGRATSQKLLQDYPESSPNNFNLDVFCRELQADFCIGEMHSCGFFTDSGLNLGLGFHISGDELHLTAYRAQIISDHINT